MTLPFGRTAKLFALRFESALGIRSRKRGQGLTSELPIRELMTTTAFLGPDPGGPAVDGRRTRGNELVIWIDDEKRRDPFAELQMCHDPGPYANSAGVASYRSRQDLSGFRSDPEFRRREATRPGAPSKRSFEPAVGVEPELPEPGACAR